MGAEIAGQREAARTFLGSLRRDARGNTLAMMAIALIPMSGLAGSAIDMARLYVVKVRLQQACDAGVLAGRKFMDDTNATSTLDTTARDRANTFFANNFRAGWMKTNTVVFTPTKTSDSQVNGTASVVVPMTIMKMFGATDATLNVTCKAKFDVADTDILFVLDTTGSMACLPADTQSTCDSYVVSSTKQSYTRPTGVNAVASYAGSTGYSIPEKANSRIAALRTAVVNFYTTFAANADPSTNVRYGFVTYSSLVNGGGAIMQVSPGSIVGSATAENATYQSRTLSTTGQYVVSTTAGTNNSKTSANCTSSVRDPVTPRTFNTATGQATRTFDEWISGACKTRVETLGPQWSYGSYAWPVQQFVAGTSVIDPTKVRGETTRWLGCLEEPVAATTPGASTFTTTALPTDLNPDATRSGTTRWFPHWQDVTYARNASGVLYSPSFSSTGAGSNTNGDTPGTATNIGSNQNYASTTLLQNFQAVCGKPIQRLSVLTSTQVSNFVNAADFVPHGNTYHDIGMIWGARLLSPTGLFANDTAAWPNRNAPNRVIVFMTDGDMQPSQSAYGMYGIEYFDRRVTGTNAISNQTAYHNARFLAECAAAKARNIDIWTVQIDTSASTEMQSCATTSTQALFSTTGSGLSTAFTSIAQRLAMLRLTQ